MIRFHVEKKQVKYNKLCKMSDIERLKYDMPFTIWVENKMFFFEQDFPVFDFLHAVYKWKDLKNDDDFNYNCIETEDNPLISFICKEDMWSICSSWQLFECKTKFTREELVKAIDVLVKSIY